MGAGEIGAVYLARSPPVASTYRLFTNNCEHFCVCGEPRRFHIEAWIVRPRRALLAMLRLIAKPGWQWTDARCS